MWLYSGATYIIKSIYIYKYMSILDLFWIFFFFFFLPKTFILRNVMQMHLVALPGATKTVVTALPGTYQTQMTDCSCCIPRAVHIPSCTERQNTPQMHSSNRDKDILFLFPVCLFVTLSRARACAWVCVSQRRALAQIPVNLLQSGNASYCKQ